MRVLVNMKKLGRCRNSITQIPYELEPVPATVRELITRMVSICVNDYNTRMESKELLQNLSQAEMEDKAAAGKISFGVNYGERKAEDEVFLTEGIELTFVRLTMLAGRMW